MEMESKCCDIYYINSTTTTQVEQFCYSEKKKNPLAPSNWYKPIKAYKDPPDRYRSYFDREMDNRVAAKDFSW